MKKLKRMKKSKIPYCKCGCGLPVQKSKKKGREFNDYVHGHNQKRPLLGSTQNSTDNTDKFPHRFKKGCKSPNPSGRPRGSKNKITLQAERLLLDEHEVITRTAIELAKNKNLSAIKICLDRIIPVRKSIPIRLAGMPEPKSLGAFNELTIFILRAICKGQISTSDGINLSSVADKHFKALEMGDVIKRLDDLEERLS